MVAPTDVTTCSVCKQEYTLSHQWPHPYCPQCQLDALRAIKDIQGAGINPLAQAAFERRLEAARREAKPDKRKPFAPHIGDPFARAIGYQPSDPFAGMRFSDYLTSKAPKLLDAFMEQTHEWTPKPVRECASCGHTWGYATNICPKCHREIKGKRLDDFVAQEMDPLALTIAREIEGRKTKHIRLCVSCGHTWNDGGTICPQCSRDSGVFNPPVKSLTGTRTQERLAEAAPEPEWPFDDWGTIHDKEEADRAFFEDTQEE